jgi:PD-(D/E)XK endonuclease
LCTGTVGAVNELRVCIDLLARGFEVFRSVSPASSCDLAVLKDGRLLRVEVRTAHVNADGVPQFSKKDGDENDHYAAVVRGKIIYIPELETS